MGTEDTRLEAFNSIKPHRETIATKVLALIKGMGAAGMTLDEVSAKGWLIQTASGTITGLHKKGVILDSGQTRKTRSGRDAVVWIAA